MGAAIGASEPPPLAAANTENTRRIAAWPSGQRGSVASVIDRRCSKAVPQVVQRYS